MVHKASFTREVLSVGISKKDNPDDRIAISFHRIMMNVAAGEEP
jgi:hypothetical protein